MELQSAALEGLLEASDELNRERDFIQ